MLTDVITALATPVGKSGVAVLRVSGAKAFEVAARVLDPFEVSPDRRMTLSSLRDPDTREVLDRVLFATYQAPASFTGENTVEVFTHGGLLVPVDALGALIRAGARAAHPGEFSRRALGNGKLDLLQVEAVGDLIDATAPAQRRSALGQLDRRLSRLIDTLRHDVLALEALVCYDIDFPEEDSGPVPAERVDGALAALRRSCSELLDTSKHGERLREGALVVIAGRPNTGKSSLFNALLGTDRAIVTDIPGTTRDAIDASTDCDGFPIRLVDTAGLRESVDVVESLGIEVSREFIGRADCVLFCAEAGRELDHEEDQFLTDCRAPTILVRTKSDLVEHIGNGLAVSAATGLGLIELRSQVARVAFPYYAQDQSQAPIILTRERHRVALERAVRELDEFERSRSIGMEMSVVAVHLRTVVMLLEEIVGVVTPDDVLDRVFASFCVGK